MLTIVDILAMCFGVSFVSISPTVENFTGEGVSSREGVVREGTGSYREMGFLCLSPRNFWNQRLICELNLPNVELWLGLWMMTPTN